MKVRLKLNYNEFKAFCFILAKIAKLEEGRMVDYLPIVEAENLCVKLSLKLRERPKKRYSVWLNAMQIYAVFFLGIRVVDLGYYECSVLRYIRGTIDEQYVSESHHRHIAREQFGCRQEDELPAIAEQTNDY